MIEPPISRLTVEEKQQFDEAIAQDNALKTLATKWPTTELLVCKVEIRVSRGPESVAEFDVLIRALTAVRGAFLKAPKRRKHK